MILPSMGVPIDVYVENREKDGNTSHRSVHDFGLFDVHNFDNHAIGGGNDRRWIRRNGALRITEEIKGVGNQDQPDERPPWLKNESD